MFSRYLLDREVWGYMYKMSTDNQTSENKLMSDKEKLSEEITSVDCGNMMKQLPKILRYRMSFLWKEKN